MNHLTSPIYPFIMSNGEFRWIAFGDLCGCVDGAIPIRPATGSRELDAALVEHWVALAQLVLAPDSDGVVLDLIESPPTRPDLVAACEPWAPHFEVFGPVRAFQDPSAAEHGDDIPASALFIDGPGAQTIERNADVTGWTVERIDERIAALALAHMQRHSPAGGRGTRTSAAGGGPLRTLVWFEDLRQTVFANLLSRSRFEKLGAKTSDPDRLFPWLAPVPEGQVTPQEAPATHLYFPVVRRWALGPSRPAIPGELCDVTGRPAERLIETIRKRAGGPDYPSILWHHPLTPYVRRKDKTHINRYPKLAATVQGRVSWRDRVGLFQPEGNETGVGVEPAMIINEWHGGRSSDLGLSRVNVWAYGHACDNAKAISWVDGRIPFLAMPVKVRDAVEVELAAAISVGGEIAGYLRSALRNAYFSKEAQKKLTFEFLADRLNRYWGDTQPLFDALTHALADEISARGVRSEAVKQAHAEFRTALGWVAVAIYDTTTSDDLADHPEKIIQARKWLVYGTKGRKTDVSDETKKPRKTRRTQNSETSQ